MVQFHWEKAQTLKEGFSFQDGHRCSAGKWKEINFEKKRVCGFH